MMSLYLPTHPEVRPCSAFSPTDGEITLMLFLHEHFRATIIPTSDPSRVCAVKDPVVVINITVDLRS